MGIEAFHFLRPGWLIALIPLLVLVAWWYRKRHASNGWRAAIDAPLLAVLLDGQAIQTTRRIGLAVAAALAIGCLAAAGPTWEKLPQSVERKEDTLIILLDLSLSMFAEDVSPSRLDRARQEVADVLRLRDEGETALIAYAGDAHAVVPLTDDTATIENLLFSLSPEMMPVLGSNPGHALELAHELFVNSGYFQGRILMITDGVDDLSSVTRHRSSSFPISVIGVGTPRGGPIPLDKARQPGRFLLTQEGKQVIAQLDESRLLEVADLTYGSYRRAAVGDADIIAALDTPLPSEDASIDVEREFDTWYDQGHWLALLLVPILAICFRRGVLVCFALLVPMFPSHDATAAEAPPTAAAPNVTHDRITWWDRLWSNGDQLGERMLRHGRPEQAIAAFDDPEWLAAAQYRSGDYASARGGYASERSAHDRGSGAPLDDVLRARYNEGNALARLGDYETAITRYEEVLAQAPDHEDAAFNKDLLERLLEEQQEDSESQEEGDPSQDQQEQEPQDQEEPQEQQQNEEEQQQDESEQPQQEPQEGEPEEREDEQEESDRDERQEALEQWLRRVPDDPGGLLRRKFAHETKQRLRRGEYENRQGEKRW